MHVTVITSAYVYSSDNEVAPHVSECDVNYSGDENFQTEEIKNIPIFRRSTRIKKSKVMPQLVWNKNFEN